MPAEGDLGKGYDYLLSMPLSWSLTFEKVQLEDKRDVAEKEQVNSVCLQDLVRARGGPHSANISLS